jgi:hypothetical protein
MKPIPLFFACLAAFLFAWTSLTLLAPDKLTVFLCLAAFLLLLLVARTAKAFFLLLVR